MTDGLSHLNSRERAVRLAHMKARADRGEGVRRMEPAPAPAPSGDPPDFLVNVEIVKATIADLARTTGRGGLSYGWRGDALVLAFNDRPDDVMTVEEAVRRRLIGPGSIR